MCGIFGIITPKPRKLDLRAFCVLGVNNDSRGGDSCGIFIDKKYEYGVNENKLFYSFFPKSRLLDTVTHAQIALGHCRKASVGAINAANAQPVVIKGEDGEVKFVLIHNGTIINYQELAKKYIPNVDVKGMTDSQVMARIIYHSGFGVLGEYLGAGAFVMVDYREGEPQVYFFKGESKSTPYATTTIVERPLFCSYSTTEFLFSSIMDYLKALRPGREVLTITPNKLLQLKDGKLYKVGEYDRSKLWQAKSTYSTGYDTHSYPPTVCNNTRGTEDNWTYPSSYTDKYFDDIVDMGSDGVYYINNVRAHGVYWVDAMGNIEREKKTGTIQVAFFKGVLLKNSSCFSFLNKFAKDLGGSQEDLLMTFPELVHFLSPIPYKNHRGQWVIADTPTTSFLYTGTATFPFTTNDCSFNRGNIDFYEEGVPYKDTMLDLLNAIDYKIDIDAIQSAFSGN